MVTKGRVLFAYTAGIVDGEGSISITKFKTKSKKGFNYKLVVSVWNSNPWLAQWLKMQYGGSTCSRSKRWENSYPTKKSQWKWQLENDPARQFLELILPYLYLKKPEAELAISFQRNKMKKPQSEAALAILEAQRILCSNMKK